MIFVLCLFAIHWYASLLCQSFFHHRYSAHALYRMAPITEKCFFVLSYVCMGSSYLSPYAYGLLHRLHHMYADTEYDPHPPEQFSNIVQYMIHTGRVYGAILHNPQQARDFDKISRKHLPVWHEFDQFAHSWGARIGWGVVFAALFVGVGVFLYGISPWWSAVLPIHFFMGPTQGAIINWFAHKIGYRNYPKLHDTSRNIFPFDIIMWGELLHNNHHKKPKSNFGDRWYEFDSLHWLVVKPLLWCRVIRPA